MTVTVIIPWREGCPHRAAALAWVLAGYAERYAAWRVVVASTRDTSRAARGLRDASQAPADQPWVKGAAVNAAVDAAAPGIVVVADADVWHPNVVAAVHAVETGAPWAVPHREVRRLGAAATAAVLQNPDAGFRDEDLEQPPYVGVAGGGIVVADRETLRAIPLDERFTGWGQEDQSWGLALTTLAGEPWRGAAWLGHLWHPPQERLSRKTGSAAGQALHRRYIAARGNPDQMRELIKEARP